MSSAASARSQSRNVAIFGFAVAAFKADSVTLFDAVSYDETK